MQTNLHLYNAAVTQAGGMMRVLILVPLLDKGTHAPPKGSHLFQPKVMPSSPWQPPAAH